jgi:hypothetical protein
VLLSLHAHASRYELPSGEIAEQTASGGGFGGFGIIGLSKNELALGLSATGVYVPGARVRSENIEGLPGDEEFEQDTWALTLGPGVAYHVGELFRIGGLMGVVVEQVPKFSWRSEGTERLWGFGAGLWLGFDWELSPGTGLGVVAVFENRVHQRRDLDYVQSTENTEQSLTGSIGASLTFF